VKSRKTKINLIEAQDLGKLLAVKIHFSSFRK